MSGCRGFANKKAIPIPLHKKSDYDDGPVVEEHIGLVEGSIEEKGCRSYESICFNMAIVRLASYTPKSTRERLGYCGCGPVRYFRYASVVISVVG